MIYLLLATLCFTAYTAEENGVGSMGSLERPKQAATVRSEEGVAQSMGSFERPKQAALVRQEKAIGEGMVDYNAVKRINWEYAQKGCLPKPYKSHGGGYNVYNCAKKCRNDPGCKQFSMSGSKCWTTSNDYIVRCEGWFATDEDVYRILAADETEVGQASRWGCWIRKDGKLREPKIKPIGHGCLKGNYKSHGTVNEQCDCYKKCAEENCSLMAVLDNKCWTQRTDEWGTCSNSNILYQYEEQIFEFQGWSDFCECKPGNSCGSDGKCVVDLDTSCTDAAWSWTAFAKVSALPCSGETSEMGEMNAMSHTESHASHPGLFVQAFSAVGLACTLFGAFRYYTSK